jgi:YkoP domain
MPDTGAWPFENRWLVAPYDRVYRFLHNLDSAASEVGPAVRVEVRRSHRTLRLADRTTIRRGDRIGVLHLNNGRVVALHAAGLPPIAVGLEFRRQLRASLHALARRACPEGGLSDVRAFEATTILFHQGLRRLGFEPDPVGLAWPGFVTRYQRALLASLRPAGPVRLGGTTYRRAQRLWISREKLLTHYGPSPTPYGVVGACPRSTTPEVARARSAETGGCGGAGR